MACSAQTENSLSALFDHHSNVKKQLKAVLPTLIQDVASDPTMEPLMSERLKRCIYHHIETKRLSRAIATATAYKYFEKDEVTPEKELRSYVAGWCIELVEIAFQIIDDVADRRETRRGTKSWYIVENDAPLAFNDSWALECFAYKLLMKYFRKMSYCAELCDLFQDVTMKTVQGQTLDILTATTRHSKPLTLGQYLIVAKSRSSYIACYLPIKVALLMSGIDGDLGKVKDVCMELGVMLTIQEDYEDIFGESEEIGTDVVEGKCGWPMLAALEVATEHQRDILQQNYGRNDPEKVLICKDLFISVGIPKIYQIQEKERVEKINSMIDSLPTKVNRRPFHEMLEKIATKKF